MTGFAARYDLRYRNASFDFFIWLTHVRLLGATEIIFGNVDNPRSGKWDANEIRRRYESILKPGAELAGIPSSEGDGGIEIGTHKLQGLIDLKRWDFPRIVTKLPPADKKYTVTIRKTMLKPFRDSNDAVWRKFAKEIGAHVIEDWSVKPISLFERVSLYAGAEMNFGVVNGPMGLLHLTPYPMMQFDCLSCEFAWFKHGIPVRTQLPWAYPHQRLIWGKQSPEEIRREFATWRASQAAQGRA